MIARVQLHNMHQDQDETIHSFGARLPGQARVSKFLVTCPGCNAEGNYTEIQLDLLDSYLETGIKTRVSKKSFNLLRRKKLVNDLPAACHKAKV